MLFPALKCLWFILNSLKAPEQNRERVPGYLEIPGWTPLPNVNRNFPVKTDFIYADVQGLEMIDIAFEKLKDRDAETSAKLVERRQKFSKKSKEHQRQCLILCKADD